MNRIVRTVFWSRAHLTRSLAGAGAAGCVAFGVVLGLQINAAPPASTPTATPTVRSVNTLLVPPTTPSTAPSTASQGPVEPIALQAADTFLRHDLQGFARVALPAAVEEASAAPDGPLGRLAGEPVVLEQGTDVEGRSAATVEVPTTGGTLQLSMQVLDGRWQCAALRFAR